MYIIIRYQYSAHQQTNIHLTEQDTANFKHELL